MVRDPFAPPRSHMPQGLAYLCTNGYSHPKLDDASKHALKTALSIINRISDKQDFDYVASSESKDNKTSKGKDLTKMINRFSFKSDASSSGSGTGDDDSTGSSDNEGAGVDISVSN